MANIFSGSLIFLICLILGCGLPSDEEVQSLTSPSNLVWQDPGSRGDGKIIISFTADNPEIFFTGFNVYMSSNSEAELTTQHRNHVKDQEVNRTISRNFIVQNKQSQYYPTIQDSDGGGTLGIRSASGTVTYTIENAPNRQTLAGNYWIAVSAYSSNNRIESALSNILSGVSP